MNPLIACVSLAACLALPSISFARDHDDRDGHRHWHDRGYHDDRGYREGGYRESGYRDGGYRDGGYRDGGYRDDHDRYGHRDHVPAPVRFVGEVIALPFEVGAAVVGGVATILTAPFCYHDHDRRQQAYDAPPRYDGGDDRGSYYGPPAQAYGPPDDGYYYPPPGYDNR